ncbi:MAG: hypothetical protein A2X25_08255 [Chloroflexi bacterium GWB2_49_20]|nr:MAG: hypothetical protein A2X25_08255 [Chloroflexi bacterium GWB2_49_20]OGN79571.1 MAG: hypothetical protein A2X26_05770 [Chloroflexi bacterium GWC2_49_37]OGN84506.1 MAG: hypothetical protein A2X27_10760 [Chloroflexi bacterium GWD2_49_16]HBG74072.1 hypothetical protein [Anaerolineae bacterium]HCC78874.1 hypothetical protein [Anaerolineae bacterium]
MKRPGTIPILLFILTACTPAQPTFQSWQPWLLSDLHLLESPNTTDPTSDLIAVYSRQHGDDFQIPLNLPDLAQSNAPIQATDEGLSLEVRLQLLTTALSSDPTDLVVLGGSLPHSTWGDSVMGKAGMAYIAAHPWIQFLNGEKIQANWVFAKWLSI